MLTDQEIKELSENVWGSELDHQHTSEIDFARAIEQAVIAKLAGVSVEPVAWMRPSVTENGIVYDSSFRDENGMVLPETREEQGFERLYTAEQLAAARVAALEEAAVAADLFCNGGESQRPLKYPVATAIRALIGGAT